MSWKQQEGRQEKNVKLWQGKGAPMFESEEENYDQWAIQWKAFAQVENLVLGSSLTLRYLILCLHLTGRQWKRQKWQWRQIARRWLTYGGVAFVDQGSDQQMARGRSMESDEAGAGHLPTEWHAVNCRRKVQASKDQDGCRWDIKYTILKTCHSWSCLL